MINENTESFASVQVPMFSQGRGEGFSSLYFMVFKGSSVFKIGKANDAYIRSITLHNSRNRWRIHRLKWPALAGVSGYAR